MREADRDAEIESLKSNVFGQLESPGILDRLADLEQRFDTLQTPLLRRIKFRLQRWPGQRNLNAAAPGYLPRWLRRIVGQ